ncbi:MAG TPA: hypothetical protein VHN16_01720 [Streptosporangiaceae bacterium]|nr:hypothetical protein [Streptosporangiaceae bacterium]
MAAGYQPSSLNTTATKALMSALKTYAGWTKPYLSAGMEWGWFTADTAIEGLKVAGANPTQQSSKAMTSLSGVSPARIAVGVWAVGTFLAGLAGVLAAPVLNVSSVSNYTVVTASAFAAVAAAKLRSLPVAVAVGLIMGVVGSLLQWALPKVSSQVTGDIIAGIPFAMVVIFLLYYTWRKAVADENLGGTLDRAISVRSICCRLTGSARWRRESPSRSSSCPSPCSPGRAA